MAKSKINWCYSFDNIDFSNGTFSDKDIALADAKKEGLGRNSEGQSLDTIYLAKADFATNEQFFPDADLITEHMALQAEDVGGDYAENYPDVSKEAEEELTKELESLLSKWCEKNKVAPTFFNVSNSQSYDLRTLAKLTSAA